MPDFITPEERAAIDAFPAEQIQRIERGRMSIGFDPTLNKKSHAAAKLRNGEIDAQIRRMTTAGHSLDAIARATRITVSAVEARMQKMGMKR